MHSKIPGKGTAVQWSAYFKASHLEWRTGHLAEVGFHSCKTWCRVPFPSGEQVSAHWMRYFLEQTRKQCRSRLWRTAANQIWNLEKLARVGVNFRIWCIHSCSRFTSDSQKPLLSTETVWGLRPDCFLDLSALSEVWMQFGFDLAWPTRIPVKEVRRN